MEAIGRVRKVKSRIMDGVEKVVEKSKEMLENNTSETDDDHETFDPRKMDMTNGHGSVSVKSDSSDQHVNKISRRVNLDEDQGRVDNAKE